MGLLFEFLNYPARISHCHAVCRNRACHHTARTDDGVFSNRNAGQDDGTSAYPNAVFYPDRTCDGVADVIPFRPIPSHSLAHIGGMRGGIYLHIRCDQDVVTDINAMVVHKSTVHVDDDLIADEDMLAIFAMEVDVHVNTLPDTAEQFLTACARVGLFPH